MTIQEPMTAATDLLIAAVSFYAWFRLRRKWPAPALHEKYYMLFFLLMGVSTVFGAFLNHAFAYLFPPGDRNMLPNWITNILAVGFYPLAIIGRADGVRPLSCRKALTIAVIVETVVSIILTFWKVSFLFAEIHIGIVLYIFSLPLQVRLWNDGFREEVHTGLAATALMTLLPIVLISKFHIGTWLNDFDISHIIIAAAMYLYYKAGLYWRKNI